MDTITRHTMVPLSLAIGVISTVTLWVSRVESRASANEIDLQDHKLESQRCNLMIMEKVQRFEDILSSIDHRLSIIEGEVKRMPK